MITLIIKQRIILAHIDGMSNRAIANLLHLSKDTVNKYVNEYNEKREELLRINPDMDTSKIISRLFNKSRLMIPAIGFPLKLRLSF